jgi:hypothetical protein
MARRAVHTGQIVTFDEMLNSQEEFAPDVDKLTMDAALIGPDRTVIPPPARHSQESGVLAPPCKK